MTLSEVASQAQGLGLGQESWQWQCFGSGCKIMLLGQEDRFLATVVYHEPTESVRALELLQGSQSLWIDPDYVEAYALEAQDLELNIRNFTIDWVTVLSELSALAQELQPRENMDDTE